MKFRVPYIIFFLYLHLLFLSSCGAVETVFKAGMWWGLFLAGIVVVLAIYIIYKIRK